MQPFRTLGSPGGNPVPPANSSNHDALQSFLSQHFPQQAANYGAALRREKVNAELAPTLTEDELVNDLGFSTEDAERFVGLIKEQGAGRPENVEPPEMTGNAGQGIAMPPLSRQVLELLSPASPKTPRHDAPRHPCGVQDKASPMEASLLKNPPPQDFELQVSRLLESLGEDPTALLKHLRHVNGDLPTSRKEWEELQDNDTHLEYLFQISAVLNNLNWPDAHPKTPTQSDAEWMEQVRREFRSQTPVDSLQSHRPGVKIIMPAEAFEPEPPVENISKTFEVYWPFMVTFPGDGTESTVCTVTPTYSEQGRVNSATVSVTNGKGILCEMQAPVPEKNDCTVVEILKSGEIRAAQPNTPESNHPPDKDVSARLIWTGESVLVDAFPGPIGVLEGNENK